jgi:hypothetical protein
MCHRGRTICCCVLIASALAVRERDDWSDKSASECEKYLAFLALLASLQESPGNLRVFKDAQGCQVALLEDEYEQEKKGRNRDVGRWNWRMRKNRFAK